MNQDQKLTGSGTPTHVPSSSALLFASTNPFFRTNRPSPLSHSPSYHFPPLSLNRHTLPSNPIGSLASPHFTLLILLLPLRSNHNRHPSRRHQPPPPLRKACYLHQPPVLQLLLLTSQQNHPIRHPLPLHPPTWTIHNCHPSRPQGRAHVQPSRLFVTKAVHQAFYLLTQREKSSSKPLMSAIRHMSKPTST